MTMLGKPASLQNYAAWVRLLLVMPFVAGCSFLYGAAGVVGALAEPTPKQHCENLGGKYVKVIDLKTGEEHFDCTFE